MSIYVMLVLFSVTSRLFCILHMSKGIPSCPPLGTGMASDVCLKFNWLKKFQIISYLQYEDLVYKLSTLIPKSLLVLSSDLMLWTHLVAFSLPILSICTSVIPRLLYESNNNLPQQAHFKDEWNNKCELIWILKKWSLLLPWGSEDRSTHVCLLSTAHLMLLFFSLFFALMSISRSVQVQ